MTKHLNLSFLAFAFGLMLALCAAPTARAAESLKLAPDLSFTDDSSSNFPIDGAGLSAGTLATDRATIIFFGTAHCWNTNREAERVVAVYPKYRGKIDFVVVDLNRVSPGQQGLVDRYYHGFIPTIAIVDRDGHVVYDRAGETSSTRGDTSGLEALLKSKTPAK